MHHNKLVFLISWPSIPQIEPNRFTGGLDPLDGTIKLKGKQAACLVTRHRILNIFRTLLNRRELVNVNI